MSFFGARPWLRRLEWVGNGIVFRGKPYISNRGSMQIGNNVYVSSLPVQTHLISAPRARLVIGDRVSISHGVAISAQCAIEIGDDAQISPYVIIMDSDFHVAGKRDAESERTPVYIGPRTRIGVRSTILRGTILGAGAEVGPGSVVSGRVPAGEYVAGNPARARDRHAVSAEASQIEEQITHVIAQTLGLDRRSFSLNEVLENLPGWDSLSVLRLLLTLEDQFDVSLREDQILSACRISDVVAMIEGALTSELR